MGKAELSVLEQFRRSPLLPAGLAERDLRARYEKLIDSLVRADRRDEASVWAGNWIRAQKDWDALWRAALSRFESVRSAEQKVSWLLEDPLAHGRDFLRRALGRA
jgi:hypothetical protein